MGSPDICSCPKHLLRCLLVAVIIVPLDTIRPHLSGLKGILLPVDVTLVLGTQPDVVHVEEVADGRPGSELNPDL